MQKQNMYKFQEVKLVCIKEYLTPYRNLISPLEASKLFAPFLKDADREILMVACLNAKNFIVCINSVSVGTLTSSLVHPREVLKPAILSNAASIIIAHNHPSGSTEPSRDDLDIASRLRKASDIIGIKLVDFLIITDRSYLSFTDKCLFLK